MTVTDALRRARDHWHLHVLRRRLADNYAAPVIIAGMYRAGTSQVSRLLRGHGVYLGNVLDGNSEAVEFLAMNDEGSCNWGPPGRRRTPTWTNWIRTPEGA